MATPRSPFDPRTTPTDNPTQLRDPNSNKGFKWVDDPVIAETMEQLGLTREEALSHLGLDDPNTTPGQGAGIWVPTDSTDSFKKMFGTFLGGALGGGFASEFLPGIFGGGGAAGSGGTTSATTTGATTAGLGGGSTTAGGSAAGLGLGGAAGASSPAATAAAGATTAGASGGLKEFFNSKLGLGLVGGGLDFLGNALSDDPVQPFEFDSLEGERGRLLKPGNAAYLNSRNNLTQLLALMRAAENPAEQPNVVPGPLPSFNVPGLGFDVGGFGQPADALKSNRQTFNFDLPNNQSGTQFLEDLLAPPPPPDLVPPRQPPTTTPGATAPGSTRTRTRGRVR